MDLFFLQELLDRRQERLNALACFFVEQMPHDVMLSIVLVDKQAHLFGPEGGGDSVGCDLTQDKGIKFAGVDRGKSREEETFFNLNRLDRIVLGECGRMEFDVDNWDAVEKDVVGGQVGVVGEERQFDIYEETAVMTR